ncbi:MAG: UDP-glucose 4-epimerase GalE [Candidatus Krumholzibacteriia bacterium]
MQLFVTGGAGYVGSVVCEELVRRGHQVTVFDNLATGHRAAVHPQCRFVRGDLRDAEVLGTALQPSFDAVLHFAARSLVSESMRDPLTYWEHNVGGAVTLLRVMRKRGVRRIVFSSSAAVYGEPEKVPIPESTPPAPTHAYGGSKRAIEMLLEDATRAHGLRAVALRYFNAAGASELFGEDHSPETHLIPNLLRSVLDRSAAPRLFGDDYPTPDGTCIRDYVHVVDLADAHVRAVEALDSGCCGAINLGSGRGQSVLEILEAVRRVTGHPIPVTVEPRRPGDPPRLVAAVQRASEELGWQPRRTRVDEIVKSAWDWLQAHPEGYVTGGPGGGAGEADA